MVEVSLFDKFEIAVDGQSAEAVLAGSRKGSQVLIYLLLNYGKDVTGADLQDVLWPDDSSTNPENALKTLISRLRAALTAFSPELKRCITTGRGTYRWNTELECSIDMLQVEKICSALCEAHELTDDVNTKVNRLIEVYSGDLVMAREDEAYSISRREFYRDMFIKTVMHVIGLYKAVGDYESVIRISRMAIDIDMFEQRFHEELIDALVRTDRHPEALAQYRHMSSLNRGSMDNAGGESLEALYDRLIRADESFGMDIESIKHDLENGEERRGAYVCDYSIFKDVYRLQMRNLSRMGAGMYLAVVMLSTTGGKVESLALDKAMRRLLDIMQSSLRKGDTIARYSPSQFAVLLPTVNDTTGRMVMKRLRTLYYSAYAVPEFTFTYKLVPLGIRTAEGLI